MRPLKTTAETPPDASILDDAESSVWTANDVRLHVVSAGTEGDPPVILLHGFPECFFGWHRQIESLVEAGFRVIVPDQRGYNLSEKPSRVRSYRLSELVGDIVACIRREGGEAHVVGHDWGGVVAWALAAQYPAAVDRLCILNAPHPTAFRHHLRSNPGQLLRSWYTVAIQLPYVPEFGCRSRNFALLAHALRSRTEPGTVTDEQLGIYRRAWRVPGALSAMLDWYRAAGRYGIEIYRDRIDAPTLVAWGDRDLALAPDLATESLRFCQNGRLERFPETGHWLHHDRADQVTSALLEHLG